MCQVNQSRLDLFLCTNPSNDFMRSFVWREFSSARVGNYERSPRRGKSSSLGMPKAPPRNILRSHKHLSLGMPKASPSSSTITRFPSYHYIFIPLPIMSCSWSVFLPFAFSFLLLSLLDTLIPLVPYFVLERDTLHFFMKHSYSSLISFWVL